MAQRQIEGEQAVRWAKLPMIAVVYGRGGSCRHSVKKGKYPSVNANRDKYDIVIIPQNWAICAVP